MVSNNEPTKIPMPPIEPSRTLFKDIKFWSYILLRIDKKLQVMGESFAYGEIGVRFKVKQGKVIEVVWDDKVTDKVVDEPTEEPKSSNGIK